MLKKILIGLAVVIVAFVILVAVQPSHFSVTRSATIAAAPTAIFPHINELKKWEAWSPWAKVDPNMKTTYKGPAAGVGAVSAWAGNNDVGEGSMTITESRPNELVRFRLDFIKPFAGTSTSEFTFKPQGNKTVVAWTMSGESSFVCKAVGLFMNCDKMMGDEFEKGLAQLKAIAEAPTAATIAQAR
jgi:hypothetical protein